MASTGMGQFGLDQARKRLVNPPDANNLPAGVPSRNVGAASTGTRPIDAERGRLAAGAGGGAPVTQPGQRAAQVGPPPIRTPTPRPGTIDPAAARAQYEEKAAAAGRGQAPESSHLNEQQFGPPQHVVRAQRMAQAQRTTDILQRLRGPGGFQHVLAYAYGAHKDPETYAAHIHPAHFFGGVLSQHARQQAQAERQVARAPKPPRVSG